MRRLVFATLALLILCAPVAAQERILSFASDVTVNNDASLSVTETIEITAEGRTISRGILRDFPTRYKNRNGLSVDVGFEVIGIKRDGNSEPYTVESIANGKRIRIGSADVFLPHGRHRYDISYRTTRQLGFFETYDELYWNVTGNGWTFPIDQAQVSITLPNSAEMISSAAYTGAAGAQGSDYVITQDAGAVFRAKTTHVLAPNEGFTVAVAWPKGFVPEPTQAEKLQRSFIDNAGLFLLVTGVLALFAYYYRAWNRVGRDPHKGTIIPLFAPPKGFGPAATRYLWKKSFDEQAFAAALVGLASKGWARIEEADGTYTVCAITQDKTQPVAVAESRLHSAMGSSPLVLQQANHSRIKSLQDVLETQVKKEQDGILFNRNRGFFWFGAIASIALLGLSALLLPGEEAKAGFFIIFWCAVWWGITIGIVWSRVKALARARGIMAKLGAFLFVLFMIPFAVGGFVPFVALLGMEASLPLYAILAGGILLALMNIVFFHLLFAPTVSGQKLNEEIEGFRLYLATAEEQRLNALNLPEKTPDLFERYLPYAMALDCENEWNAKFASVLATAAAAGQATMAWYSGRDGNLSSISEMTSSLGASIASSNSAPGSSSGSFGGGSSGGGGGGGGGSGW